MAVLSLQNTSSSVSMALICSTALWPS